jgi:shikimate dehydrogenase
VRRLLAVLGRDVSRSRSPELHARAAAALGLDVAYVPVCCADEAHFDRAVLALGTLGARGANVTIPYKARALAQATVVTPRAELMGAANVLSFEPDGAVLADNTDGPALVEVLGAYDPRSLERVVVLGAGGAARAVVWALGQVGAREVVVCARDPSQAERLVGLAPGARAAELGAVEASLVVSSLPGDPSLAVTALDRWIRAPAVLDLAYGPPGQPSALAAAARARGLRAEDGLAMLVGQAALSLGAWTGAEPQAIHAAMSGGFDSHSSRA